MRYLATLLVCILMFSCQQKGSQIERSQMIDIMTDVLILNAAYESDLNKAQLIDTYGDQLTQKYPYTLEEIKSGFQEIAVDEDQLKDFMREVSGRLLQLKRQVESENKDDTQKPKFLED